MRVLLVIYDNESFLTYFPMGAGYLVSAAREAGYDVEVYDQNIYHYHDEHLTEHLNANQYDVVGVGMIAGYHQYKKLIALSKAINQSKKRPFYVLGGHMSTPDPEYFIRKTQADAVVLGEGEVSFVKLLDAISAGGDYSRVKGIAYRDGEEVVINEREDLIEHINTIAFPSWSAFNMQYYTLMRNPEAGRTERCFQVVASRGCIYNCSFCYRMDEGFRLRSPDNILEEIGYLYNDYNVKYINFTDELFACSEESLVEFCEALLRSSLKIKFYCNGRLNYASKEVLKLMKAAGCVYINYGIESLDPQVLKNVKKGLSVDQIRRGINNTIEAGVHPGLNVIFGNVGDTKYTLDGSVEFLLKHNTYAELRTIRPVTPYPGSPLYYYAIENGLLKGVEDFYENKHKNSDLLSVNFTDMTDEEFNECLYRANSILIKDYFRKLANDNTECFRKLYYENDISFRGPRQT